VIKSFRRLDQPETEAAIVAVIRETRAVGMTDMGGAWVAARAPRRCHRFRQGESRRKVTPGLTFGVARMARLAIPLPSPAWGEGRSSSFSRRVEKS
jgi:hypothetical protein